MLGDQHGNVLHLHERDCSVQRRHQKVIEIAPVRSASRPHRAQELVRRRRRAWPARFGYDNAGTVEFLYDLDTQRMVFHRDEPAHPGRAHGHRSHHRHRSRALADSRSPRATRSHGPEVGLPPQEDIPRNGYAVQCRITTEDPENKFTPDYGKILTYRSAGGFGIRLDGGMGDAGAVITPFYDSLLVKITASGRDLRHRAAAHGPRAARVPHPRREDEHPVPGKRHPQRDLPLRPGHDHADRHHAGAFRIQGRAATAPPSCSRFSAMSSSTAIRRPRATSPTAPLAAGARRPPTTASRRRRRARGSCCSKLGPKKFAAVDAASKSGCSSPTPPSATPTNRSWPRACAPTTCWPWPTPWRAARRNCSRLEMWGGATFDTAMRFLHEDPWERLRALRERIPNICFQMLFRGSNAVGYSNYPDECRRRFRQARRRSGHRYFPHLRFAELHAQSQGRDGGGAGNARDLRGGDLLHRRHPRSRRARNIRSKYYVKLAKELEKMGAHFLAIKDMAGLCRPYAAHALVKALKEEIGIPIHFHTHDTSGVNAASVLQASDARRGRRRSRASPR